MLQISELEPNRGTFSGSILVHRLAHLQIGEKGRK